MQSPPPTHYSFDIFDTVLTRLVTPPKMLFFLLQDELLRAPGTIPVAACKRFAPARIWAEFKARRQSAKEDVSFQEIYAVLQKILVIHDEERGQLEEKELEMEFRCIVPIAAMARHIARLRSTSQKIIYISDMYLPTTFLKRLLTHHRLFLPGDTIYTSGDIGRTKGSGNLYQHVLDKEGVAPQQLLHHGDNPYSDVSVPRTLGIQSQWIGGPHPSLHGPLARLQEMFHYLVTVLWARTQLLTA